MKKQNARQGARVSPRGLEWRLGLRDDQPPKFLDQFNASPPTGAHLEFIDPDWTEATRGYTKRENIPIIPLYLFEGRQALSIAGMPGHHQS